MRSNRQSGFSLVEITVALAIVSGILIIAYSLMEQTMRTAMFNESQNDLAVMAQRAVNELQSELVETRVVFEDNALGHGYRDAMQLPSSSGVRAGSLLPVIEPDAALAPDGDERRTGNTLLVARQLAPLPILYDHDGSSSTPEVEFLADRYRFDYVFLSAEASSEFARRGPALDLMMATSREYADYFQLNAAGAGLGALAQKLVAAGLARAWNPGQPVDEAFYALSGALDGSFDAPVGNPRIDVRRVRSLLPGLRGGRVGGSMAFSVAFVPAAPAEPLPIRLPVSVYAPADLTGPAFPAGFEVKVAGPAGHRRALTRLVLASHYGVGHYTSQQAFVTTSIR
jgi:prepilin-type N-terminal cleavage/methylation domain-containing protein